MITFGQRLKILRKEASLTQGDLAEQLMVAVQTVSKWECDTSMPDISQLIPLSALLGVTTDCLLGIGGNEKEDREKMWKEIENINKYCLHLTYENNAAYKRYEVWREH
ncbi:MAG: helix-turn-helix transcriptional regulator, partial [Clostridia bacterium]|nr:helix-turn-helix transcriptional regulator [Clostridia bacterium]